MVISLSAVSDQTLQTLQSHMLYRGKAIRNCSTTALPCDPRQLVM